MGELIALPVTSPTMVGRTEHLAFLQNIVEQAKGGRGQTVLIGGEAGIGKSRLVLELKTYAATQNFFLLQGQCFPADSTYPYAPLLDLLRSLHATQSTEPLAVSVQQLAQDIFPLLPELAPAPTLAASTLDPEQEKRRLFAVLARFFLTYAALSPVLFVIEDVHWSDATSLDFLHYLARRSSSAPFILLFTYRSNELSPSLNNWIRQLDRERLAQYIHLAHLDGEDIDAMLSSIFDAQHTTLAMRRFLQGNPFFVEEILSSLIAAGDIFYKDGRWHCAALHEIHIPQSVQEAVQRRMRSVSDTARNVMLLAAVAGRHFDFALLQQLTSHDEHQLLLIMKDLVSAQLVIEESADRFAFRHALTRHAIYSQLLSRERRILHQSIAETLEQQASVLSDVHIDDLAYHFYHAQNWQKAMDYARRAGERALGLYSHRAAIDYFTWALEAAHRQALSPPPMLYRARGQANEKLGEFDQAEHDYTQAFEEARKTNNRVSEWQSAIDLGFLWAGRDYVQAETWFRLALTLSQALDDPSLRAHSFNRIGNWHLNVEQPQDALRYHQEALRIFQQLQDSQGIAETLDLLGMTSYLGGDLIGGTIYYQRALALFDELGNKEGLTSSLATLSIRAPTFHTDTLIAAATLADALLDAERAVKIAHTIGQRSAESYALLQLGLCLGSQGDYARALAVSQQSLRIAEEIEHRQWQTAAHATLGGVFEGMLAYQQAKDHFQQALALAQETHSLFWTRMATGYLASLAIHLRDTPRAEALLQTIPGTRVATTMAQRMLYCASAELALAQGQPFRALEILDPLMAFDAQTASGQSSLRFLHLRGQALAALERLTEAEATLNVALALATSMGVRPKQWRISLALGNLYYRRKRIAEAEQALSAARALVEELASTILDGALRNNFLQKAAPLFPSSRSLSPKQAAKQAYGGLTAREREIAILIAQGKYNREIAEALVLSERTVETHVSNIMLKLSFSSRAQIASWATEKGLIQHS